MRDIYGQKKVFDGHKNASETRKVEAKLARCLLRTEGRVGRTIVAYSRPKNIGDFVTKTKLHQAPGKNASTILGEFRQDSAREKNWEKNVFFFENVAMTEPIFSPPSATQFTPPYVQ